MPIALEIASTDRIDTHFADRLARLAAFVSEREPVIPDGCWQVTVRFTDDVEIGELHARYFGDPSPTDVISFPAGEALTMPSGYLGDIAISVDTARVQATQHDHFLGRELAFLFLHGLLHLCGLDDRTREERRAMLSRQADLLSAFDAASGGDW